MLKNYFKIAFRNISKNKIYSFISVSGLAVGLAGFILISILIKNELSYDSFHKKGDRIYRVVEIQNQGNTGKLKFAVTMSPLAPAMKDYFPDVENSARIVPAPVQFCKIGDKGFYEKNISYADPSIFDIFTIPFIEGSPETALIPPFSIVITQTVAHKYFGKQSPLGKSIHINSIFGSADYKVTGLIKDYPENSHIYFDMLCSYSTMFHYISWLKKWDTNSLATYVLLRKGASPEKTDKLFPAFINHYIPPDPNTGAKSDLQMYLQPLKDIHLYSGNLTFQTYNHNQGSISTVYIFSAIALFILLIASINFMNLTTARSSKRLKEIGIRKVLGSARKNLVYQFTGEAILISFIALMISLLIVEITLPEFKEIFSGRIIFSYGNSLNFFFELIGITLGVGIISGIYPALFLSKFQPAESLKGILHSKLTGNYLRKILVVLQFSIAISLIVCTGIVSSQMSYVRNKNLGFNKDHVLYLPVRSKETREKIPLLKSELLKNSNVIDASASSGLFSTGASEGTETVVGTNGRVSMKMRRGFIDFGYIETMKMEIVKGRNFSIAHPLDSVSSVIINETAVRKFGWKDPIGKHFVGKPVKTVIGVVKDFNFFSLHSKIGPLVLSIRPDQFQYLVMRIKPEKIGSTINYVKSVWESEVPGRPFDYSFLDQHFDELYKNDQHTGDMFGFFSFLAIFIACLGLFGLAAYTAEQRTKEIGVRKVLGASVYDVVNFLSKDFIIPVLIANVFAWPATYYIMNKWLQDFAYRINISWWIFILSGGIALIIAVSMVSLQAIKAATVNPVKSLRYE